MCALLPRRKRSRLLARWVRMAARKQGVKRVVFASSNHVSGFYRQDETITADHPARPDGMYGLSKAFRRRPGTLLL